MQDFRSEDMIGDYKTVELEFYGGFRRLVLFSEIEIPYPDGKLIVSTTDKNGFIIQANKAFIEMSAYSKEELIGAPHSILRHPDMPSVAFKDLWETVQKGLQWQGIVKNLRKDGAYYWVKATVIPNIRNNEIVSYTSVRRKPSRAKVAEAIKLYSTLTGSKG